MRAIVRVAGALTAGAMVMVLAGCGGGDQNQDNNEVDRLANDTPAAKGELDRVVWALPYGEPASLDPVKAADPSTTTVVPNLCESVLTRNADLKLEPGLATDWEWRDDTTLRLTLRDDATFWDGTPVTAEDVAYSLERSSDPSTQSIHIAYFERVREIAASGPNEVTITFSRPDSLFVDTLATPAAAVVQKTTAESAGADFGSQQDGLMCSGPYRLADWRSGEAIDIESTGTWWGGKPLTRHVEFRFITDPSTLSAALASGEIDGALNLTAAAAPSLRNARSGTLYVAEHTAVLSIIPMTDQGLAADPRVREGIDLAIDKEAFVDGIMSGTGGLVKSATPPPYWSGDPAADIYQAGYDALPDPAYDPEKAEALLEDAGAVGSTLNVAVMAGDRVAQQAATVMQDALKEVGVTVEVRPLQPAEFFPLFFDPQARAPYEFVITPDGAAVPTPLAYMPGYATPDGQYNFSGYSNDEVTRHLEAAREAANLTERASEFVAAQEIFNPDRPIIPLTNMYQLTFLNERVTGIPVSIATIAMPWATSLGSS